MSMEYKNVEHHPSFIPLVKGLKKYGISKTTTYKLVKQGRLQVFHIGRNSFVRVSDIDALAGQPPTGKTPAPDEPDDT